MLNFKERLYSTFFFLATFVLIFIDVYEDILSGAHFSHIYKETFILFFALLGFCLLWIKYFKIKDVFYKQNSDIILLKKDLEHYKDKTNELSVGISDNINQQMNSWKFTNSEKDIALLLLKGLTIKEIAEIRDCAEKTIKQHATNLYNKSNLSGRAELSAFFLEDILVLK